jgi:hypothetical protein
MREGYVRRRVAAVSLFTSGAIGLLTGFGASTAHAAPFTSPVTNAFLSVDINGGNIASNNCTTEGSNGPSGTPVLSPDPFGVQWQPWGGPTNTNGDGTQLPSSQSSPNVNSTNITKTFGSVTATLIAPGTSTNYGTVNGVASMNSRDRGSPTGAAGDSDLFRDLMFAGTSGSNVQSTNYIELTLSGLTPNTGYEIATYSYDSTGTHTTNWTATAPTNGTVGWTPGGTFTAPADEQSIAWTPGTTPAPAIFSVTTDPSGSVSLWAYGGNGVTGNQNSDTTYINGFQVAVPEPASIGLLAISGLVLFKRRRQLAV